MPVELLSALLEIEQFRSLYVKSKLTIILIVLGPWTGILLMSHLAFDDKLSEILLYPCAVLYVCTILTLAAYHVRGPGCVYAMWLVTFVICVTIYVVILRSKKVVKEGHPERLDDSLYFTIGLIAFSIMFVLFPGIIIIIQSAIRSSPDHVNPTTV